MTARDPVDPGSPRDLGFPGDPWVQTLVTQALAEDVGAGDASTAVTITGAVRARGTVVARAGGVIAGVPLLALVFGRLDPACAVTAVRDDGAEVGPGDVVARIAGPAAALLTGERCALNFLQQLSGVASLTARYVAAVAGTPCRVLDTRKTVPGYRHLAKYAVRCGGGHNHRLGLYDRIMLKDNHWAAAGDSIEVLVARASARYPQLPVEVEVDSLAQLDRVLPLGVEWILLDNFNPDGVAAAVGRRNAAGVRTLLEASGNVTLETIGAFARAGADAASVGRLTHSAPALDLSLDLELGPR
jgi:nicotinate-nucleotide pyrophosphorylase (carboxylating)